jgi:hypothetical protein
VVELPVTGRPWGIRCGGLGHGLLEPGPANDCVHMGREDSGGDDRVATLDGQRLAVDGEDLAMDKTGEGQAQSGNQDGVNGRHGDRGVDQNGERVENERR